MHYPRIEITFCTKCKWQYRATWYLQELLSTFDGSVGEVALVPVSGGIFQIKLFTEQCNEQLIWDRKLENGFPDSKELKKRIRDVIDPGRSLGHTDRHSSSLIISDSVNGGKVEGRRGGGGGGRAGGIVTDERVTDGRVDGSGIVYDGTVAGERVTDGSVDDDEICVECNDGERNIES